MLTHTGEKTFQCPHCPHRAGLKFNLSRHIRTVHKDMAPATSDSYDNWKKNSFISSNRLLYSETWNKGEAGGGCSVKSGGVGVGVIGVSGVETEGLACSVCGKIISGRNRRQRLQYHLSTHTGERPHHCPFCPYRAHHKFTLDRHIRTVHRECFQPKDPQPSSGVSQIQSQHSADITSSSSVLRNAITPLGALHTTSDITAASICSYGEPLPSVGTIHSLGNNVISAQSSSAHTPLTLSNPSGFSCTPNAVNKS
ncbi:hypothetical protein SK128_021100, partial [Halocaridina rubra]